MKKFTFLAALTLILGLCITLSVCGQIKEYVKPQSFVKPVIPVKESPIRKVEQVQPKEVMPIRQPVIDVCAVSDTLLKEVEDLSEKLEQAKERNDYALVKNLSKKISTLKGEIEKNRIRCQEQKKVEVTTPSGKTFKSAGIVFDPCKQEQLIRKKLEHYKKILSLPKNELEAKGYKVEKIDKIIKELTSQLQKFHQACVSPDKKIVQLPRPVAPQRGEEVTTYYKEKVAKLMSSPVNIDEKIGRLKELRNEIDTMIEELIRAKKKIQYSEIKPLVKKIVVQPGKIDAGKVSVKVSAKKDVEISMKNKKVNVSIEKNKVSLGEEEVKAEVEVSAPIEIEQGKVFLGGKEIKTTPGEAVRKISASPEALIKLSKEKEKPVYKVSDVQRKRILGIFPVRIKRDITIDASSENSRVIKIKRPWWSFLAF